MAGFVKVDNFNFLKSHSLNSTSAQSHPGFILSISDQLGSLLYDTVPGVTFSSDGRYAIPIRNAAMAAGVIHGHDEDLANDIINSPNLMKWEKEQKLKTNHRYSILVLTGLPKKKFIEVCAHELGHDWMNENFPKIKDLKLKEGWAEYFASEVNKLYEQKAMNKRIETNTSKVYGDGYRFIRDYVKRHGNFR